jgi:tRNA-2-methylthio-N6-dimethylallyladenosine synthase
MKRGYTSSHYRMLVETIRRLLPDADVTTDFLVGFPSETEEDFLATLRLAEELRFTAAFMFAYSRREGTAAALREDDVPREVKIKRLNRLISLQTSITKAAYNRMVGRDCEVMAYGAFEKKGGRFLRKTAGASGCSFLAPTAKQE